MKTKVIIGISIAASIIIIIAAFMFLSVFMMKSGNSELRSSFDTGAYEVQINQPQIMTETNKGSSEREINDMYFQDYGTNIFISTAIDKLSTFALDVDTASFSVAKNYIMRGTLPPTEAIRPEEFINYFDYNYQNPEDLFGITTDMAKNPFEIQQNAQMEQEYYLTIGVKAQEPEIREPLTLTLIIDISGSMNTEGRLGLVKNTLNYLIDRLEEGDSVAIITYNTQANLLLEHTPISDKSKISNAINSLSAVGSTNAEAGLIIGYEEAKKGFRGSTINKVVLISDGVANVGSTSSEGILSKLPEFKSAGISLLALGVGMGNYNDVLLEQIANNADGSYAYINDIMEARRVIEQQLSGAFKIIARDAKIQVEFNEDVVREYRLIGYENRLLADDQFKNASADAGEIGSGHEVTAIYELRLTGNNGDVGEVRLRYVNTDSKLSKEIRQKIYLDKKEWDEASHSFKIATLAGRFAQILKLNVNPLTINVVDSKYTTIEHKNEYEKDFGTILKNAKDIINSKR